MAFLLCSILKSALMSHTVFFSWPDLFNNQPIPCRYLSFLEIIIPYPLLFGSTVDQSCCRHYYYSLRTTAVNRRHQVNKEKILLSDLFMRNFLITQCRDLGATRKIYFFSVKLSTTLVVIWNRDWEKKIINISSSIHN